MKVLGFFRRWKQNRITKQIEAAGDMLTERERCMKYLEALNTNQFALYHMGKGMGYNVNVPYHSIDDYTETLTQMTKGIKRDQMLRLIDTNAAMKEITLDDFFVSPGGFYQDIEQAVVRFRKRALELCEVLKDTDSADYGLAAYHARVCAPLLKNIADLTIVLMEASLSD